MSLIMTEQLQTREEAPLTDTMSGLAHSSIAAQTLDDRSSADLWNSFPENELNDQEERDDLDSTGANLLVDDADPTENDDGGELGMALSLYLREMGRVPRLSTTEEIRLALLIQ